MWSPVLSALSWRFCSDRGLCSSWGVLPLTQPLRVRPCGLSAQSLPAWIPEHTSVKSLREAGRVLWPVWVQTRYARALSEHPCSFASEGSTSSTATLASPNMQRWGVLVRTLHACHFGLMAAWLFLASSENQGDNPLVQKCLQRGTVSFSHFFFFSFLPSMINGGGGVKIYGTVATCFIPLEKVIALIWRYICHFKVLHLKTIIKQSYF